MQKIKETDQEKEQLVLKMVKLCPGYRTRVVNAAIEQLKDSIDWHSVIVISKN